MSGLTDQGLVIQRLNDVLAEQRKKAVELFQDLVPAGEVLDTSDNTTIGRLISVAAPSIADLWEAVQQVDSAFDPEKATGIALDKIVKYGGIERLKEQHATAQAIFTVTGITVIPYNSAVRGDVTNAIWRTRSSITVGTSNNCGVVVSVNTITNSTAYTISYTTPAGTQTITYTSDGSATRAEILNGLVTAAGGSPHNAYLTATTDGTYITLTKLDPYATSTFSVSSKLTINKWMKAGELIADIAGAITQEIGTIKTITTPVLGWDSVSNYTTAVGGSDLETDDELRLRFRNTKYERASNILEALYSALISADGVTEVVIYENDTDTTDGVTGTPPHSFMPFVVGGDTASLAKIIWQNKPLGIKSYQASGTYPTIYDSQGFPHLVGINRPTPVPIYISIDLTKTIGVYPADGDAQIKTAIVEYLIANFGIGDDILYTRLFTPINSVVGHYVNTLTIGTSPSPSGTSNVTIAFNSIYTLDPTHIIITG